MEHDAAVIAGQTRLGVLLRQHGEAEHLTILSNIIAMRHFSA